MPWCSFYCTNYSKACPILKYIVSKAFLWTLTESLLIRPINLLQFFFWSTWILKSSFESKTMPKFLWWGYFLMTLLLKATGRWELFFDFLEEINLFACLFLSELSSAKILHTDVIPSGKSFMKIKKEVLILTFVVNQSLISWCLQFVYYWE